MHNRESSMSSEVICYHPLSLFPGSADDEITAVQLPADGDYDVEADLEARSDIHALVVCCERFQTFAGKCTLSDYNMQMQSTLFVFADTHTAIVAPTYGWEPVDAINAWS